MSNIFSGKKAVEGDKIEDDFLGGGGVFDTDIYGATIKHVYLSKSSSSDAQSVNFIFDVKGRELRTQIWVTNRNGEVTYKDKKTKELKNLPGYSQVNAIAMLAAGKELGALEVEEMTVKIYDYDAKKELPTAVDCFTELHGYDCNIAVQRQTVDKTEKNESTGNYEPTGETRDVNEVIKMFPEDKLVTISEINQYIKGLGGTLDSVLEAGDLDKAISKMPEDAGVYAEKWLESNRGKTYNKSKGSGKTEGKSFSKEKSSGAAEAATGLFD